MESSAFFDLSNFEHKSLFQGDVWTAITRLKTYFQKPGKIEIDIPEGVYLGNREFISIGKGTVIEPGVYILGPCIIGKNCTLRHGAYLRENVILGNNCSVGHCAEIKNSILLDGAAATHFVYVGDSILGNRVNLGAGVKCANLRLDRKEVKVKGLATGLKKMGAIIGDESQIGCNCVINPGALLKMKTICRPLENVNGNFDV